MIVRTIGRCNLLPINVDPKLVSVTDSLTPGVRDR